MTYDQSAALMTDQAFRGRVKVACLKFANAIIDDPAAQAAPNTSLKWANQCMQQPDNTAMQVQPPTVMDAQVQTDGSNITDTALQSSVEATVKKMM